jgi:poly-beta-1,6-N-acetyl-D-glucosamine synthase
MNPIANASRSYVVVSPVRDEIAHIEHTLQAMVAQSVRPLLWVIVDDGSTDGTGELLQHFAGQHPWVRLLRRSDRGVRVAGGGVIGAFYDGYREVETLPWDFVVKLDGDLSFDCDYFARCLSHFANEPRLGVASGTVCVLKGGKLQVESRGDPAFHVRGPCKIYRAGCWKQISPLVSAPGWDTLDDVRANLFGWSTRTFPDLCVRHHKPTGSAYGAWSDAFKRGIANYNSGYHPAFMAAKCVKRLFQRPYLTEAAGLGAGFASGYLKRRPMQADKQTVRFLREQQWRRLTLRSSIYG